MNPRAGFPTYSLSRGAPSPLGYFSMVKIYINYAVYRWRRGRDSNSWSLAGSLVFKTSSLNHSDTSPCPSRVYYNTISPLPVSMVFSNFPQRKPQAFGVGSVTLLPWRRFVRFAHCRCGIDLPRRFAPRLRPPACSQGLGAGHCTAVPLPRFCGGCCFIPWQAPGHIGGGCPTYGSGLVRTVGLAPGTCFPHYGRAGLQLPPLSVNVSPPSPVSFLAPRKSIKKGFL